MKSILTSILLLCETVGYTQWTAAPTGTTEDLTTIAFANSTIGLSAGKLATAGNSLVLRTTDGGTTWATNQAALVGVVRDIAMHPGGNAIIVADSGRVYTSSDYGDTWSNQTAFTTTDLSATQFISSDIIVCGDADGTLYKSLDGGVTWNASDTAFDVRINQLLYQNNKLWLSGEGGIIASSLDTGNSWQVYAQPYFGFFSGNGIAVFDTVGYAVSDYGFAVKYHPTSGWTSLSIPTANTVHSVASGNLLSAVIIGDNGFIYRTEDGNNWIDETYSNTTINLLDITYIDAATAIICGTGGTILKSTTDISGIADHSNGDDISLYPNPATNGITLRADQNIQQVSIFDIYGKLVVAETDLQQTNYINLEHLQSGMYLLRVETQSGISILPFIKQ
jgi:photosystem II stability/assembly factor-like uncharacterized protein